MDELTSLVVKLFSEVENKNVPVPEFPEHPFQEEHLRVSIEMLLLLGLHALSDTSDVTVVHCILHYFCINVSVFFLIFSPTCP